MNKKISLILGLTILSTSILFTGCGKKEEADAANDIVVEKIDEASEQMMGHITAKDTPKSLAFSTDDTLVGTYVYKPNDEQEERFFEIFRVADKYYIEYIGNYDYAGAELQINGKENEMNCFVYSATLYAFSGFSFMGDYWGAGDDIHIKASPNGDIVLGEGQPFLDGGELKLKRKDNIYLHESEKQAQKNTNQKELCGTWRCISERDKEKHEITMVFSEDGSFKAVNKIKNQTPIIYIGSYKTNKAKGDVIGEINCEIFAYGGMPDSWVLCYDENGKHPYVYSDYMYAEPFTYKEADDMNLPFEKISYSEKSTVAAGPGNRASEVQKMFDEYNSGFESNDEGTEIDQLNELVGVWQLDADTPAGDPYIFQLEVGKDNQVSYCGYSMTGNNWFQNFCYDGQITQLDTIEHGKGSKSGCSSEHKDGSFDICIEASELDYNGRETDRITCEYNVKTSKGKVESIQLKHISGQYIAIEDTDAALSFVKADKAISAGDLVNGGDIQATSEQIGLLEEAISIFPVSPMYTGGFGSDFDISNEGWSVLGSWVKFADNKTEYAGLDFEKGKKRAPDNVFSAYGYFDSGDKVDFVRIDTKMLEEALRGFFGTDTSLDRRGNSYDCTVDNKYVTLWGNAYNEAFEYLECFKWLSFEEYMEGDILVIDAVQEYEDSFETREYAMSFSFYQNPDSFYGYSLIGYNSVEVDSTLNLTLDQIKNTEKFIREFVNGDSKEKEKVSLKAGTDGCPYARDIYYISGSPIFAYYYNAKDGSPDNRYYFECDKMVEWIEGNGTDDSKRKRHYASDNPLDSRWKKVEKSILGDAKKYGKEMLGHFY